MRDTWLMLKANLATNYKGDGNPSEEIAILQAQYFNPKEIEVEIDKSPGFSKTSACKVGQI
jgi:hypothetical protein